MDITQLRYFLAAARHLNYSRAAQELFITRQSLRQAIAAMEDELGRPLFANSRNKLSLTPLGEYLALSGSEVVEAFDGMMADLGRFAQQKEPLRVAFSDGLTPFLLPDVETALERFRAKYPDIPLESRLAGNDEVIRSAEAGEVDCGCVIQMPWSRPGCVMRRMVTFPAAIDYALGFPIPQKEALTLEDLDGVPCIGMGEPSVTLRPLWEDCQARGVRLNYQVCRNTIDAFYQIQHGLAAGFDILTPDDVSIPVKTCPLAGYTLELGFLCPQRREKKTARLFRGFIEAYYREKYGTRETEQTE